MEDFEVKEDCVEIQSLREAFMTESGKKETKDGS